MYFSYKLLLYTELDRELLYFKNKFATTHKKVNIFCCNCMSVIFVQHTSVVGLYDEVILFVRTVEDILLRFRVRMRLQLMAFGDPKNQQTAAVPDM
jgi:hypothetical protein